MSHGRQPRGRNRKMRSAQDQAARAFLDNLHRDDPAPMRNWNNAPPPGTRPRPRPPAVLRTQQRDGSRLVPASRSQIEKVLSEDGPLYFITDQDGNVKMLKIERDPP